MRVPERYELVRRIADGGMASVWCAEDQLLGRRVAIKLLADPFAHDDTAVRRFQREARVAARLSAHRHVVTIYDVGIAPDGRPFIVMEHLAGGTAADALRVGEVERDEAVRWIREASSALDYAHERGVIHRDIKPGNLLLDCGRILHVADFGIARIGTDDTMTRSDQVFGTAGYLAPERAVGRPATAASDRYSLGVAAFELLVGERPFTAESFTAQARAHLEEEPPEASLRNPDLPRKVDAVLARGMAKDPDERWPSAGAFADAIESAMFSTPARATRTLPLRTPRRAATAAAARRPAPGARTRAPRAAPVAAAAIPSAAAIAPAAAQSPVGAERAATAGAGAAEAMAPPPSGILASDLARGRRRPRRLALGALAAAAAVAVAVIAANQGSSGKLHASSHTRRLAARPAQPASAAPAKPAPAPPPRPHSSATTSSVPKPKPTASPSTGAGSDALEARGHALMVSGSYQAAIPVLRQAVAESSPSSLTYAYALFDLGRSLRLAGNPRAAVQVLWQRMQIPNQTDVVRSELQLALEALGQQANGQGGSSSGGPAGPTANARPGPPGHGA